MPSNRQSRQQRHMSQVKQTPGSAQRGRKTTENVPGSGYRESQYIGGKKYYSPLSTDPNLSITGGSATTINVSGGMMGGLGTGVTVHADLSGLDTDDHDNYVHVGNQRTITAPHVFTANVVFSGEPQVADMSISDPVAIYTTLNHNSFLGYVAAEHINWTSGTNNAFLTTGTVGGGAATFTSVISPTITTAVSTALTLSPTTNLILNPSDAILVGKSDPSNVVTISSDPFTPGFTGGGWQINSTDASITATNMTLRGTLSVYELLIQQIRATNGSIFVSASAKVDTVTGSAYTETIVFEDPSDHDVCPFVAGDIIMAQRVRLDSTTLVKRHVREVDSVNANSIVCKATSGGPSDQGGTAIESGDDFVRLGSTSNANRRGGVYLTADDTGAPFIDIFAGVNTYTVWNSTDKVKARLGRLDGIADSDAGLSGSQTNYFGLYSDNVHLKGTIFSEDGTIGGFTITSDTISAGGGVGNIFLKSNGNLIIVGKTVSTTRYGLFLYETNGTYPTSDYWAIFHDVDDSSATFGELCFNYEGTNSWKFLRDGKIWSTDPDTNGRFWIKNNRVRIDADSTNQTSLYYEVYSYNTALALNEDIGGLQCWVSDVSTDASYAGVNGQFRFIGRTDGKVAVWINAGANYGAGAGNGALTKYWKFDDDGNTYNPTNSAAWNTTSDMRVKENIENVSGGLSIINSLDPITFNFKEDFCVESGLDPTKQWGFSAQDFKSIIPEAVATRLDYGYEDFHNLNTGMLVPILVAAVKELKAEIDALKE